MGLRAYQGIPAGAAGGLPTSYYQFLAASPGVQPAATPLDLITIAVPAGTYDLEAGAQLSLGTLGVASLGIYDGGVIGYAAGDWSNVNGFVTCTIGGRAVLAAAGNIVLRAQCSTINWSVRAVGTVFLGNCTWLRVVPVVAA